MYHYHAQDDGIILLKKTDSCQLCVRHEIGDEFHYILLCDFSKINKNYVLKTGFNMVLMCWNLKKFCVAK